MDEEMIRFWLANGGSLEDIFGAPYTGIPVVPPADMDDYGTVDGMRDLFNMQQDANDLVSDQATMAQIGLGAGGVRPEDFQPNITYTPVQAPAFLRLQQMKGSPDPVSQIIAGVFLDRKGTALMAEDAVLTALQSGEIPTPVALQDESGRLDRRRLQDMTRDLEKMVIDDPVFNAYDPATGMPANATDEDGNPLVPYGDGYAYEVATPTPTMEYFDEMNLTSPFETYDPNLFAGEGDLEREANAERELIKAMNAYTLADESYRRGPTEAALEDADVKAAYDLILKNENNAVLVDQARPGTGPGTIGGLGTPLPTGGAGIERREAALVDQAQPGTGPGTIGALDMPLPIGGAGIERREGETQLSGAMSRFALGGETDAPSAFDRRTWFEPNRRTDDPQTKRIRLAQARAGKSLGKQRMKASEDRSIGKINQQWADLARFKRQQFANELAAQGYSPFGEEMRGRQQQVYGG